MSWQAAVVRWAIRRKMRRGPNTGDLLFGVERRACLDRDALVQKVRKALDEAAASFPAPMRGTWIDPIETRRIRGEWIGAPKVPKDAKRVIFYCHGGGYFWGKLSAPRNMLARLSKLTGARVFSLDYRLAPEAPFPAAHDDAMETYSWLVEDQRIDSAQLVVGGESAGGGLALSLLTALKGQGRPVPAAAFLFSPWTDLTVSGASIETNAKNDPVATEAELRWAAHIYLNGQDGKTALASPLFADLSGLPPILIQVGSTETLLDDSRRLADAIRGFDGSCTLEIWPHMHHVWQLHSFFLPEGRSALAHVANFIDEALRPKSV